MNDINLAYLAGYKKLDEYQTLSASLRYFSLGDILFYNELAEFTGQQNRTNSPLTLGIPVFSLIIGQVPWPSGTSGQT